MNGFTGDRMVDSVDIRLLASYSILEPSDFEAVEELLEE
jgi:hypothetical protein